jgi:uncharacterized membrane protein YqaE (UPF0057 family)
VVGSKLRCSRQGYAVASSLETDIDIVLKLSLATCLRDDGGWSPRSLMVEKTILVSPVTILVDTGLYKPRDVVVNLLATPLGAARGIISDERSS